MHAKRKAKQASSQPSSDDPFAAHRRREEDLSRDASTLPKPLPKKKTPPLKRPAARPSAAAAHKRPRDETYAYATGDAGAHETPSAYASTNPATTTAPPSSSADPSAPRVVFVSDLPEACAAESLASALYRFGNVDDARVAEGRGLLDLSQKERVLLDKLDEARWMNSALMVDFGERRPAPIPDRFDT